MPRSRSGRLRQPRPQLWRTSLAVAGLATLLWLLSWLLPSPLAAIA